MGNLAAHSAKGLAIPQINPRAIFLTMSLLAVVLFSCHDRNIEIVFLRDNWTTVIVIVRAIRIVRIIEIEIVNFGAVFFEIDIPSACVSSCTGRFVCEWQKKIRRVLADHLINMQMKFLSTNFEIELTEINRGPHLSAGCGDTNAIMERNLYKFELKNQIKIWRKIIEMLEGGSLLRSQRRRWSSLEICILLQSRGIQILEINICFGWTQLGVPNFP